MRQTQASLTTMTDAVKKQFEEVRTFTASSNQLLEKRLAAMEESASTNRVNQENLQNLVDSFRPAVLEYHNHFKAAVTGMFDEFHSTLNQTLKDINTQNKDGIMGQLSSNQKAFEMALAQHQKGTSEMLREQRDALHAFADMVLDARLNSGLFNERISSDNNHHLPQPVSVQEGGRQ
jgi:flagellar biosynthesis/type III secretory pathway chaperone